MEVLGIDIGGTSVKAAMVDVAEGALRSGVERWSTPSDCGPEAMLEGIAELRQRTGGIGSMGIGFPGVIQGTCVRTAANLSAAWIGYDFGPLGERWHVPIRVGNDADAAGLAEMKFGAGRTLNGTVLVVTAGTGIGTALFHRGHLLPNTEFGHLRWNGQAAEKTVSASARTRESLGFEEWGRRLGAYLRELERLLWPDAFILGGGISEEFEAFADVLETRAPVYPAQMGNAAGIVGAALFALDRG